MITASGIYCGEYTFCGSCEKCMAKRFIRGIENWFSPMPSRQRLVFFIGLLRRCSSVLVGCLLSSVKLSSGKEKAYSLSKTNPQLDDLNEPPLRPVFGSVDFNSNMLSIFLEFLTFTDYQKKIILFHFFKMCDDRFLADLSSQMFNMIAQNKLDDQFSSDSEDTELSFEESPPPPQSTDITNVVQLEAIHDTEPLSNYESEEDGFATEDDEKRVQETSSKRASSAVSTASEKRRRKKSLSFGAKNGKDLLTSLPIGLAKRILGYLDKASLANCLCVSTMWRQLTEEVQADFRVQAEVNESVKLMQGSTGQLCNPRYARFSDVLVPNVDLDSGMVIHDPHALTYEDPPDGNLSYGAAFSGIQTRKVIMEEKNIYCGPFNVMVVVDQPDKYRVIHNDGGSLIASGSRNRKIALHDLKTGQTLDSILDGHSGSVRCIRISSADGLVFSGSYDTGVRVWDLKTGKFTKVFNGHQATVLCLAYENQLIVSGSVDRTCRVWSLKSLKCIRKFYHRSAVTAVAIRTAYMEERVVSGDVRGHVKVWNLRTGHLIKVLHGHSGEVTAIDLDRWFIISASRDNYVMGWSNQGNHKRCLFAFAHPDNALSVSLRYLRAITGCADGRIRIWSLMNGNCIKVLRGNSKNDAILSANCTGDMLTLNTESNVIVMKFEPVKYNYTTSQLYLPNSALTLATRNAFLEDSDNEFDSNGDPLGGRPGSRPHSAVRATRMHILQRASKEIGGSRASLLSRHAVSTESLHCRSRQQSAASCTRPHTTPQVKTTRKHGWRSLFNRGGQIQDSHYEKSTCVQDPSTVTSILDHRCYPLRHCDLEQARRIQSAATLPPWKKEEQETILQEVRDRHRRLVEKRRSIREQRQQSAAQVTTKLDQTSGESDGVYSDDEILYREGDPEYDRSQIRRLTWSHHRAHLTSASTYSLNTFTEEGLSILAPEAAPNPPSLNNTQRDLRKTLIPGAHPPALQYVRVSVSEAMRQDKEDITTKPPVKIVPPAGQRQRHNSVSLDDKTKSQLITIGSKDPQQRDVSSAYVMRKMILSHKRDRIIEQRMHSAKGSQTEEEETVSPEEAAAIERKRLVEMAKKIETGGWEKIIKEVSLTPVSIKKKPSPVGQTVFADKVTTSIPKPIEVVSAKPSSKGPATSMAKSVTTPRAQSAVVPKRTPMLSPRSTADPIMKVPNYDEILSGLRQRTESIKVEHDRKAQAIADSQLDYRLEASSTPDSDQVGPKPLTLATNALYDSQTAKIADCYDQDRINKQRKLEAWRRKKWSLLATGKITPNQLHGG